MTEVKLKKRTPQEMALYFAEKMLEKRTEIKDLQNQLREMKAKINTPELNDFIKAIKLESAHQIERWGPEHDKGKSPEDWMWVIAYLSTKATQASRYGDLEKYKHHIITCAAACLNWHRNASG